MNRYLQRRTAVRKSLYRLSHQPGALARPPLRDIGARSESVGAALVQ